MRPLAYNKSSCLLKVAAYKRSESGSWRFLIVALNLAVLEEEWENETLELN